MPVPSSSRVVLAATVLLALFSGAYLLARRWAGPPSVPRRLVAAHAALTRWLRAHTESPAEGVLFTGGGLEIDDTQALFGNAMQTTQLTWFIPYAELRPLVRPGTPLARRLRARGLW